MFYCVVHSFRVLFLCPVRIFCPYSEGKNITLSQNLQNRIAITNSRRIVQQPESARKGTSFLLLNKEFKVISINIIQNIFGSIPTKSLLKSPVGLKAFKILMIFNFTITKTFNLTWKFIINFPDWMEKYRVSHWTEIQFFQ